MDLHSSWLDCGYFHEQILYAQLSPPRWGLSGLSPKEIRGEQSNQEATRGDDIVGELNQADLHLGAGKTECPNLNSLK